MVSLENLLDTTENKRVPRQMSETLENSRCSMWYLDKDSDIVSTISSFLCNKFPDIVNTTGTARNVPLRTETIDTFRSFVEMNKLPSLVTYLKYEAEEEQGAPRHHDVDSVFCTALLYVKYTIQGGLQVEGVELPEKFEPGDVVFMDPRQIHDVETCVRGEERKVLVFTMQLEWFS